MKKDPIWLLNRRRSLNLLVVSMRPVFLQLVFTTGSRIIASIATSGKGGI